MFESPTEADFRRAASLIGYDVPLEEIHDRFVVKGTLSEEEFFLCFAAGRRLVAGAAEDNTETRTEP